MGLFDKINQAFTGRTEPIIHQNPNAAQGNPNPADGNKGLNNPNANPAATGPNGTSQPTVISPLDEFKDMWKNATTDGKTPVDPLAAPLLTNDPAKLAEATRKMNFTSGIDPALAAKALGGDAQSLMDMINQASQNAFMSATQLSTNMVEGATKTNNSRYDSVLNERFKAFMVGQEKTSNPILQHEAAAPMLDMAKRQLMSKHPDKSASEIQSMAEKFLTDFGEGLAENRQQAAAKSSAPDPYDFSSFGV